MYAFKNSSPLKNDLKAILFSHDQLLEAKTKIMFH